MYVLDGLKVTESELKAYKPTEILSLKVFKGPSAIETYGEDGKNGVIEIQTKAKNQSKTAEPINEEKKAN